MAEIKAFKNLEILERCMETAVLQADWFHCRIDPFHLKSHHAKFKVNPLKMVEI